MAGLVPAIHVFLVQERRGCPARGRAWRGCCGRAFDPLQAL